MRSGTTTLYRYLARHSNVVPAANKEIHFFDKYAHRGLRWYRSFFPLRLAVSSEAITGEATPYYLFHPRVPELVADMLGEVRLMVVLRDPVERAFSHYRWGVSHGRETLDFPAALEAEEGRIRGEQERLLTDHQYRSLSHQFYSYKARGIYVDQLERWFAQYDPSSMMVIKSESLFANPSPIISDVMEFLGLPDEDLGVLPHRNVGSEEAMDPRVRVDLQQYFRPFNQRLCELLGWSEGW